MATYAFPITRLCLFSPRESRIIESGLAFVKSCSIYDFWCIFFSEKLCMLSREWNRMLFLCPIFEQQRLNRMFEERILTVHWPRHSYGSDSIRFVFYVNHIQVRERPLAELGLDATQQLLKRTIGCHWHTKPLLTSVTIVSTKGLSY